VNPRVIVLLVSLLACDLQAGSLTVTVKDSKGAPVSDAVVYAKPSHPVGLRENKHVVIDQRNKQFVPYVTAVQVGTAIAFPNSDAIRHHVYSFSPAKRFELPLYAGVPSEPVLFDKEGFVTLGCNIHDWMVAYVAVLTTPYFQLTRQEGHAVLKDLPGGSYTVAVWQPSLKGAPDQLAQQVQLSASDASELAFTIELKPDFRSKRAPSLSEGGYR
jgi:plastocyanin